MPDWIERSSRGVDLSAVGSTVGTALAGGVNALSENTSFAEGLQAARASQQDPMWPLKARQLRAQIKAVETATTAKWLEAERKSSLFDSMNDSMTALGTYDGSTPVPTGITSPTILLQANKLRQQWQDARNKVALTEIAAAKADAQIQNMQALVGIKTEQQKLAEQKLEAEKARWEQDRLSREKIAEWKLEEGAVPSVQMFNGKPFLLSGKNRPIALDESTPFNKAQISIATEHIKALNRQLSIPANNMVPSIKSTLQTQLQQAVDDLRKIAGQDTTIPKPPSTAGTNSPSVKSGPFDVYQLP